MLELYCIEMQKLYMENEIFLHLITVKLVLIDKILRQSELLDSSGFNQITTFSKRLYY